jgi:hypothetical protein
VPRSKYTKTAGPLPPIERISREAFQFDDRSRLELISLLPRQLQQLGVPENIGQVVPELPGASQHETLAKLIVALTEHQIQSYMTTRRIGSGASVNPANFARAIRELRAALKPFVKGWVDYETAEIIPGDLDERLAHRERQLAGMRVPPLERRNFVLMCQRIGVFLKQFALANDVAFEERDGARYVAAALDCAGLEHSYSTENSSRFVSLVFPQS